MNAEVETRSAHRSLRVLVIAAGIVTSILYVVVGLISELQMFGDGSIFSYAVAAQDAWSFHWHNISGRLFTYVFAYIPAEAYVALTQKRAKAASSSTDCCSSRPKCWGSLRRWRPTVRAAA